MGTTALILGIIGVLAGIIPLFFWLAGILGVIGLVLGFVGRGRFERSEATNGTIALWGIITSLAAMVLSGVGLLILVGVFADQSEEASVDTESTVSPAAETSSPALQEDTSPTGAEDIYTTDLEVGDCLGESTVEETFSVETVPCSEPHSHEVFASVNLPDGDEDFPGYQVIDEQAEEMCIAEFEGFVGFPYDQSTLEIRFMTPSEESWLAGDRLVHCAVYDPAGDVGGSLRGAER
ncbi:MAG TPA: septum formation family protein [Jiangellaceae bacterium]|nr:septum formation family protein [Jiangellaceae bacterium]